MGLVIFYTSAVCGLRPPAVAAAAAAEHRQVLDKIVDTTTTTVLEMDPRPPGETRMVLTSIATTARSYESKTILIVRLLCTPQ